MVACWINLHIVMRSWISLCIWNCQAVKTLVVMKSKGMMIMRFDLGLLKQGERREKNQGNVPALPCCQQGNEKSICNAALHSDVLLTEVDEKGGLFIYSVHYWVRLHKFGIKAKCIWHWNFVDRYLLLSRFFILLWDCKMVVGLSSFYFHAVRANMICYRI